MATTVGHLVIVGASLAGVRAVEAARKDGFTGRITLIGEEIHAPYDRPPLSKAYLDDDSAAAGTFHSEQSLREDFGVDTRFGTLATGLDTIAKQVLLEEDAIGYDALIVATGARARALPGTENLAGVHTLRTLDDAAAVRDGLAHGARIVVVGAGFIGSEVASGARARNLPVTVVEAAPVPLTRAVGEHMGIALSSLHARYGTDLRHGVAVARIEGGDRVERVVLADGTVLDADIVVAGIGADPAVDWLVGSGLVLDNGVVCDENLFTGVDGVYAAGDVARWNNTTFDRSMRVEHWSCAAEQGSVAARNALNPDSPTPYATVPYFWSDWYGNRIQFVGVPDCDEVVVVDGDLIDDQETVTFYRTGERLTGVLTVNRRTEIMKYRALIARSAHFDEALDFAEKRRATRAAKIPA